MSTLELRSGSSHRGYRRKKNLLDLNVPPSEIREQEGTSQQAGPEQLTSQPVQPVRLEPRVTIDVEDIDDDVESIEPREFDEAVKNNSKRTHGRHARSAINNQNKRRRGPSKPTVINCDEYINLESSPQSIVEEIRKPQPPPKEPTFNCPICMGQLVEEMSTKCGHIFCKACIHHAISFQGKCPTCRKKVTANQLIRVFLPSAS